MADGKIVIDTDLDNKGVEKGLKELTSKFKDVGKGLAESINLKGLDSVFNTLTNKSTTFGKAFNSASVLVSSSAAMATASVVALGAGFVKLYETSKKDFFESFKNISNTLQPAINAVKALGQEMMTVFTNITGFEFSFGSMITEAIEFESAMASVAAVMGATGDGINQITMVAREFGATTRYSATQVAEAFTYMGMAGWSAQESITGMSSVLNLATIGATNLGVASDIVTDGLTALQMSASQAGNFVDMLAATITSSNTNVEMFGETMKYVGSVAGSLGVDMADLSVATGLMADSGIKASNSGTALRTLLTNLSAPTSTAASAIKDYGIEVVYASDGSMDLNTTLINLRDSLKSLPLKEQAEAAKALAGKTGMAGLLAIVNATDERFNELTDTINNSTQSIDYWNENCAQSGKVGKEATDTINMMKDAYKGAETTASGLNLTTQDLALAVQLLGADADVTSTNVESLLNVLGAMKSPSEEQAKIMKDLGITYKELGDRAFDYNKTCAIVDSSIVGLTRSQKEQIKSQLNTNMTLEEANNVLKQYDMTAKSTSTGQIDMIANLEQLRNAFKGMDEATINATLQQLGLGNAIAEVNEVVNMSDEDFKLYCDNLDIATGLAEKMAKAMDETTKNSLLTLSSALTDVGLAAFEKFKVGITNATETLTKFFDTWRGEDFSYSFENFKLACDGLLETVKNMDLAGAMSHAIGNLNTFITGGGLSSVLAIGGEIVSKICDGIIQNQKEIEKGISSAISQISNWISSHAGEINDAGRVIIDSIKNGIEDNKESISSALDAVAGVMRSWISGSGEIQSIAGEFGDVFIEFFVGKTIDSFKNKASEFGSSFWSVFGEALSNPVSFIDALSLGSLSSIWDWFTGKAYAAGEEAGYKVPEGMVVGVDENGQYIYDSANNAGQKMGQGAVDGAEEGVAPLATIMELQEATLALQQSATNMYNGAKVSFTSLSEVGKQAMTDMYIGMQGSLNAAETSVKTAATNMYLGASQSFNSLRDAATSSMVSLKNVVTTQSSEARNVATTAFISLNNVINTQFSEARNSATTQMISIKNVISTQASESRNIATSQFISIKNVINTQITEARNAVTNQMISIKNVARVQSVETRDAITTQFISIKSVVTTQITEARNAFTNQMISMSSVARTQANNILATFRSCASQMHSIGVQMGAGLKNGLASQRSSIIATANSIANSVSSTMRRALDIHSPSRVMRQIGVYTVEGLEVGMNSQQSSLRKTVDSNAFDMFNKMKSAVDIGVMSAERSITGSTVNIPHTNSKGESINEGIEKVIDLMRNTTSTIKVELDGKTVAEVTAPFMDEELAFLWNRK